MHWKKIETIGTEKSVDGIGTDYYFYDFSLLNSEIGFLCGEYKDRKKIGEYKRVNIEKNKDAIVLCSKNGGRHWQEIVIGKGEIRDFNKTNDKLFTLRRSYHGISAEIIQSHIHVSTDQGQTWKEIYSTSEAFDEIHFWTESDGVATMGLRGYIYNSLRFMKTKDGGQTWEDIYIPHAHRGMDFEITKDGILYFLTSSRSSYISVNLKEAVFKETPVKFEEVPFSIILDNQDHLYFITENKDKRNVLFRREGNSFIKINFPFTDTMINDVWIYDNIISIIVDENGGSYYRSEDYGRTWKQKNFTKTFIRDIAFFGKDNIWIRTVPGQMLVRE
ncbi:hypothetical protein PG291_09630 [Riemerella anatipestifer]|nr:hypothetical protein [Riemerella anatipestifer]